MQRQCSCTVPVWPYGIFARQTMKTPKRTPTRGSYPCSSTSMVTTVSVISTFTTIQGSGKVAFDCDVQTITIGDVKKRVENLAQVPASKQSIWWRGYILDDDTSTLLQACRGVNEGENIDVGVKALTIFMTEPIEKPQRPPSPQPLLEFRKPRMPSFDFTTSSARS